MPAFTRRTALQLAIAGFVAGLAGRGQAQAMADTKVIVIGAGIAGLAAARQAKAQGAHVTVYEAGPRIGGRIWTDHSLGAPFEHGAGWIHGPSDDNPVKQLADAEDLDSFVTDDTSIELFGPDGAPLTADDYTRLEQIEASFREVLQDGDRFAAADSVEDVLRRHLPDLLDDPWGRWILASVTEFDIGASIGKISARNAYADMVFPADDVILPEGYDLILAPLAEGLDIRLNRPVTQVKFAGDEDGVYIDGEWADYVVCAVPLGVLKAGQIRFDPPLPASIRDAVQGIGVGSVTKIALKFDQAFWDTDTQYFGIQTDPVGRWGYWVNYMPIVDENILLGLSFGDYSFQADRLSDAEITRDAMAVLGQVWGADIPQPSAMLRTAWSQDPLFHGAYSYPNTGTQIAQYEAFEDPVLDRLFWAGEHTIFDYHGTTHGALMSGRRAAQSLVDW